MDGAMLLGERRVLGLLALQGAFEEHEACFKRLPKDLQQQVQIVQVRKIEELDPCDALVIPGGESTTMKIIAGTDEFMEKLRTFVHGGAGADGVIRKPRPVWGTCAGLILLSDNVVNQMPGDVIEPKRCKYGASVGGLNVSTCRNFFGRQANSFEASVQAPAAVAVEEEDKEAADARYKAFADFPGVFIRAPAILKAGPGIRVLATVRHPAEAKIAAAPEEASAPSEDGVIVAVESRQILVTCFHPEVTQDSRIHGYFIERFVLGQSGTQAAAPAS